MIYRAFIKRTSFIFILTFLFMLFYISPCINFSAVPASNIPSSVLRPNTIPGSSDPTEDEWPMFRGQLNHTGVAYTTTTYRKSPFWTYTTADIVRGSPAVVGGRVYVGSGDLNLYCLNATTGERLWSYITDHAVFSSPAVAGERVYVGSYDKKIYCLNATTGERLWNYTTGGCVHSCPAVAGGRVYVGSDDFKVYCLNATTGESLWNYTAEYVVSSSPAVAGGRVYVGSGDYKFYCLDATNGKQLWNYSTGATVHSSPAVADGRVYVGSLDGNVYCLNAITGKQLWNYTTGESVGSSPAVAGGRLYVGSCDRNLYCLNATTGGFLWSYLTGDALWSSPAVAGGHVYVGSYDDNVYCLNAITGGCLWNYTTGGDVDSSPAVAGGRVYVGSWDCKIYCLPCILETTSPSYIGVIESADPLELGGTETITIYGVAHRTGILTVLLEFEWLNHTMTNLGGGTWQYLSWNPTIIGTYPYTIYLQNTAEIWNATSGAIHVVSASPTYTAVIESVDPLEIGSMETITIVGVADLSGIQTVLIAFEGTNHTMTNLGGGAWHYSTWSPSEEGEYLYTIYIQDTRGHWNATSGTIQVTRTPSPPNLEPFIWILALSLIGMVIFTLFLYRHLNKKIQKVSQSKPIPPKDLPKK